MQRFWTGAAGAGPPVIARAHGVHIWDKSGKRYIDVTSGPIAVNIGHGNERVLAAMREQASRVCFAYPSNFESPDSTRLSALLAGLAGPGLDCAFFVSGGSEAVEKCLQFARRVALARGEPGRYKVISRNPSYHGSTRTTMSAVGRPGLRALPGGLPAGHPCRAPSSYRPPEGLSAGEHTHAMREALRARIIGEGPDSVLAFIMEPVMGFCGGADSAPPDLTTARARDLRRIRRAADL